MEARLRRQARELGFDLVKASVCPSVHYDSLEITRLLRVALAARGAVSAVNRPGAIFSRLRQ
jgi:hypothetical protein